VIIMPQKIFIRSGKTRVEDRKKKLSLFVNWVQPVLSWLDHYIIWIFHMVALPLIINDYKDIMITVLFYIETVMIMVHFWIWKRKKNRVQ
jgi:hypothetical protein